MLSPTQLQQREGKLTASRIACLMTGDQDKIMNLWREMVGDPDFVPEDLSGVWAVQLGSCTEAVNLDWFERKHGPVSRRGDVVVGAVDWMAATLDGWSDVRGCPVECKHVGGREPLETIIDRYQPQMHWQMIVTGATECALSVIMGASEPTVDYIPFNPDYAKELSARAHAFMECVRTLTPPVACAPVAAPVKAEKTYDMTRDNMWGSEAAVWLEHRVAAKKCATAEKELKGLVPLDAVRCHGHGIQVTRDRAGRLSLREQKL